MLSEESRLPDYELRKTWSTHWLVDPLDGTKEFIGRNGEFTVNVALIRDGEPVAGWVWVPVMGVLYRVFASMARLRRLSNEMENLSLFRRVKCQWRKWTWLQAADMGG